MTLSPLDWVALLALAGWAGLMLLRHGFWRADQRLGDPPAPETLPAVTAIVPARNEAATIGATVESILAQDYAGALSLIVVDDSSSDGTAEAARAATDGDDRLHVIAAPPLPPGWSGKLWALAQGISAAREAGETPEFVWFTDADAVHRPDVLRRLVAKAEGEGRDLVSLMICLRTESLWEKLIVPAFVFFFQMLYPFPAVNRRPSRVAGAAGGCVLVRRACLEEAGGIESLRDALIDDCTLAARIRDAGGDLWLGLADGSRSLRAAEGLEPLWRMVKRTAFTQLGYSTWLLVGAVSGLALLFLGPPVALVSGLLLGDLPVAVTGALALAIMLLIYAPTLRVYGRPAIEGLLLPGVALLYTAMTLHSAIDHWRGRGSAWKGRDYARTAGGDSQRT